MEPIVDEVREKYSDRIEFVLLDITRSENDEIATKYRVYLTPTFVITDENGKEKDRLIGEVTKKTLETFITKSLKEKNRR